MRHHIQYWMFTVRSTAERVALTDTEYFATPSTDDLLFMGLYYFFPEDRLPWSLRDYVLTQFARRPALNFAPAGAPPQYLAHKTLRAVS